MPRAKRIQTSRAAGTTASTPLRRDAFVAGDIVSVIRQSVPSLSPSEQRVAMALLADVEFAIHASNAELARGYADAEALRAHPEIAPFLTWIAGKDPDFHAPTRRRR